MAVASGSRAERGTPRVASALTGCEHEADTAKGHGRTHRGAVATRCLPSRTRAPHARHGGEVHRAPSDHREGDRAAASVGTAAAEGNYLRKRRRASPSSRTIPGNRRRIIEQRSRRVGWGTPVGYGRQHGMRLTFQVKHLRAPCDSAPKKTFPGLFAVVRSRTAMRYKTLI